MTDRAAGKSFSGWKDKTFQLVSFEKPLIATHQILKNLCWYQA
jgi:hypothetical protein